MKASLAIVALTGVLGCAPQWPGASNRADVERGTARTLDTLFVVSGGTGLDVSPSGEVYVTEAESDVVVVVEGGLVRREGGPGAQNGAFDGPSDVDASSGLTILVADANNQRVQHFSREFRHLGNLEIDVRQFRTGGGETGFGEGDGARSGRGTPVSIAVSAANELFVVDASSRTVLKYGPSRAPERIVGDFGSGAGALVDPVSVATDGERYLYVADRTRGDVVVFDLLGSYVRSVRVPGEEAPTALATAQDGRVAVLTPGSVHLFDPTGALLETVQLPVRVVPVDVAFDVRGLLLVLTRTHVLSVPSVR